MTASSPTAPMADPSSPLLATAADLGLHLVSVDDVDGGQRYRFAGSGARSAQVTICAAAVEEDRFSWFEWPDGASPSAVTVLHSRAGGWEATVELLWPPGAKETPGLVAERLAAASLDRVQP